MQHQNFKNKIYLVFVELFKEKAIQIPFCVEGKKQYVFAVGQCSSFETEISKLTIQINNIHRTLNGLEESFRKKIQPINNAILKIARQPKDERDETALSVLVEEITTLETAFKTDEASLQEELKRVQGQIDVQETGRHQAHLLVVKFRPIMRQGKLTEVLYLLDKYLDSRNTPAQMFLNGSCAVISISRARVMVDPALQSMQLVNLVKLFPEWNLNRVLYMLSLVELISRDDYKEKQRDYNVGYAAELFAEVFSEVSIWSHNFKEQDKVFVDIATAKLDTWLRKPMTFDELIEDRLIIAHHEHRSGTRNPESVFKGGSSLVEQLVHFNAFAEENLNVPLET